MPIIRANRNFLKRGPRVIANQSNTPLIVPRSFLIEGLMGKVVNEIGKLKIENGDLDNEKALCMLAHRGTFISKVVKPSFARRDP